MPARTPVRIRGAIIAVFSLLTLALVLPSVSAQFGPNSPPPRPEFPGSAPRPKPRPTPSDRFRELPVPPVVTMPESPDPRTPAGRDTGRSVYPGKTPSYESVWICDKCKKEVVHGLFTPQNCPHCGVTFSNGSALGTKFGPKAPSAPAPVGIGANAAAGPEDEPNAPQATDSPPSGSNVSPPVAPEAVPETRTGRKVVIIVAIVSGILILIVVAVAVIAMLSGSSPQRPVQRAVRRSTSRYDDDD